MLVVKIPTLEVKNSERIQATTPRRAIYLKSVWIPHLKATIKSRTPEGHRSKTPKVKGARQYFFNPSKVIRSIRSQRERNTKCHSSRDHRSGLRALIIISKFNSSRDHWSNLRALTWDGLSFRFHQFRRELNISQYFDSKLSFIQTRAPHESKSKSRKYTCDNA